MHRPRPSSARRRPQVARRFEVIEALESRSLATESLGIITAGIGVATAASAARAASGPAQAQVPASYAPSVAVRPVTPTAGAAAGSVVIAAASPAGGTQTASVANASATSTAPVVPQANRITVALPAAPVANAGGGGAIGTSHGGSGATSSFAPFVSSTAGAGASTPATAAPAIFALPTTGDAVAANVAPTSSATTRPTAATTSFAATPMGTAIGAAPTSGGTTTTTTTATGAGTAGSAASAPGLVALDITAGQVIYPGSYQDATLGASVELRGQTINAAGATFSWNTAGLTKATGITGGSTADLKFQWATSNTTATTNSATLSVSAGGSTTTQTYTFAVPAGSGTASTAAPTWPTVLAPDAQLAAAPSFAVQDGAIDANSGAFDTTIALPTYNPNVPGVTLAYDSLTANPQPIFDDVHTLALGQAVPSQSTAQLTFNNTTNAAVVTNTSGLVAGDVIQTPLQANATGLSTGRYGYSVATADVRSSTATTTASGSVDVVNNASSAIGSGWTVAGLEKIVPSSGGVMLDLGMGGRSLWFAAGSGTTYTDPAGEFSTLTANSNGTYTRTLTNGFTYQFNGSGQETSALSPAGIGDNYAYNANGTLYTITDNYNLVTTFAYTGGVLSGITDPANRNTTFTHTSTNLTGVTLPDSSIWGYAYNSAGLLTTATDPDNHAMTVGYDAAGRATGVTNPDSTTESFAHAQEAGTPASGTGTSASPAAPFLLAAVASTMTDQASDLTTWQPDWQGLGLTDIQSDAVGAHSTAVRDGNGLPLITGDPDNRFTLATYDAAANVLSTVYPDGTTSSATYNNLAEPKTVTNRLGNTSTYTYDTAGDEKTFQDAAGNSLETWDYTNGLVIDHTGPNLPTLTSGGGGGGGTTSGVKGGPVTNGGGGGGVIQVGTVSPYTTIGYNNNVGEASSSTLNSNATGITYYPTGLVHTVTLPRGGVETWTYDLMNRLKTYQDANNNTTTYGYDLAGNLTTVTDPLNHTTTTAYDAMNRPTTVTDPRSAVTTTGYDQAGRVTSITDPDNNKTTYTLDADGRTLVTTDPLNHTTTVTYDAAGQVTQTVDRDNRTIAYAYNPMGQVLTEKWLNTSGTAINTVTSTYDNGGNLTKIADNSATLTYTYDKDNNQVTASTAGTAGQPSTLLTTTYAGEGYVTGLSDNFSAAAAINYYYDASARLMGITSTYGGNSGPQVLFGYDADSNLTSEARSISYSGTTVSSTLGYDTGDRLKSISTTGANNATLDSFTYGYDNANRLTSETNAEGSVTYGYDNSDELTSVTGARSETYTYDANGNRTMSGYSTGTNNQVTAGAGYTYTYDNEGNLLTKTQTSSGNVWTYTWDYRNRLTGVVEKNSSGTVLMTGTYTYDPLDRRIGSSETVGGTTTQLSTVYNGISKNPYADFDGSGNLVARYLTGFGTDQYLARIAGPGTLTWYLTDHEGSVRDIVNTSGSVIDHVAYDSYGNITAESSPSNGDRMKFDGMAWDAALGGYYDNARYYDPTSGRFESQDPTGFGAGDTNLYRSFYNNPSNLLDTTGDWAIVGRLVLAGVGATAGWLTAWWGSIYSDACFDEQTMTVTALISTAVPPLTTSGGQLTAGSVGSALGTGAGLGTATGLLGNYLSTAPADCDNPNHVGRPDGHPQRPPQPPRDPYNGPAAPEPPNNPDVNPPSIPYDDWLRMQSPYMKRMAAGGR